MQLIPSILITIVALVGGYMLPHKVNLGANSTISNLTAGTSLDDADLLAYVDNSGTPTTKKITWANATSSLKTFYDGLYSPIFTTSAGLAGLLNNETGSGLAVFNDTPTLSTPILTSATLTTPYINVSGTEARGDLLYLSDSGGTLSRLGIGSTGNILQVSGGIPSWGGFDNAITFNSTITVVGTTTLATTTTALLTGNVPSKCYNSVYASTTYNKDGIGQTMYIDFPHTLGYAANSWRSSFNSIDPNGTVSQSWGWGSATTTGDKGGVNSVTYVANTAVITFDQYASSSDAFIHAIYNDSGGGTGAPYALGYVNWAGSTSTQIKLVTPTQGAGGGSGRMFFTLEQCI